MNKGLITAVGLISSFLLAHQAQANSNFDLNSVKNPNVIGLQAGYGSTDTKMDKGEYNGDDRFIGDFYYRRMLGDNYGVELGYHSSTGGISSTLVNGVFDIEDPEYKGPRISAYVSESIYGGIYLYGKAGVSYFNTSYKTKKNNVSRNFDESAFGGIVAGGLGWQGDVVGFNLEADYAKDANITSAEFLAGVSLRF